MGERGEAFQVLKMVIVPRLLAKIVRKVGLLWAPMSPNIALYRLISPNIAQYRPILPNIAYYRLILLIIT